MDASNPIVDSSKRKVRDLISDVVIRRRQDLKYLTTLVSGSPRAFLASRIRRDLGDEVFESELERFESLIPPVDRTPLTPADLEFLDTRPGFPVSGLMLQGEPIHTPGVHQAKGLVSTNRVFGGAQVDREFVRRMLAFRPLAEFQESLTHVYTRGTAKGFAARLKELTGRKIPQIATALQLKESRVRARLYQLLPVDLSVLESRSVTWHSDLAEQLDEITLSAKSGAGPPYWVQKPQALKPLLECVLPLLHKAISEGKTGELFREQPELFLGEVKNKLDRYDKTKLDDKTRPYFSLPFHFQVLFSMMSQPFTEAMTLFHEGMGSNAYGFSWAHGGGAKLVEWAKECKDLSRGGKPRFCAYGDDTDIYYRKGGKLYRISPDFRQMDGSVDAQVIHVAIDYTYEVLAAAWGENPFFRQVAELWKDFATQPSFLIHGSDVYQKRQVDGLMTGVVGTTLFDTAKSVLAYDAWTSEIEFGNHELLKEGAATHFFQSKFGLVVKPGTWKPVLVQEEPIPDQLFAETKFLGMYMMWVQGPEKVEPVPYLPDEDWTNLIMTPRDDPETFKRGRPKDSQIIISRKWYDRMRGYMVTGAFSNPLIQEWIHGFVNTLDPVSIVMSVQACGGKGTKPDSVFMPADFEFPDSAGFPSQRWCENLYFSADNQWPDGEWLQLFPALADKLEEFRQNHKPLRPVMAVLEVASGHPEKKGKVHAAQQVVEWTSDPGLVDYSKEVERMDPISGPKEANVMKRVPNKRSKILDVVEPGKEPVERSYLPNQMAVLSEIFSTRATPVAFPRLELGREPSPLWQEMASLSEDVGLSIWKTPVMLVTDLAARTGLTEEKVISVAREAGLYVLGRRLKIVTKIRLITGDKHLQKQQAEQEAETKLASKVISKKTTPALKVLKHQAPAEPMSVVVQINREVPGPHLSAPKWRGSVSVTASLNALFQANALVMRLRSRNIFAKQATALVETELAWKNPRLSDPTPTWLMRVVGSSSKANARDIYDALCSHYNLWEARQLSHSGWAPDPGALPKKGEEWSSMVESEERARITDERGRIFSIRGPFLFPERSVGPWLELDQGKAVIEGVKWKQRKGETLTDFAKRTVKRLELHGLKASFETLTKPSQPKRPKPQ